MLLVDDHYIFENENLEVTLARHDFDKTIVRLEVNGYRILFEPTKKKKQQISIDGDLWPGIKQRITHYDLRFILGIQFGYVLDEVLEKYESQDEIFEVSVQSGTVQYGNQWAVTHCNREGRNAIKVDLKKLYEGTPYEEIEHWKSFAIHPEKIDYSDKSIAYKSQLLVRKYMLFARILSDLLSRIVPFDIDPESLVSFDQSSLDNYTIYDHEVVKPITHHVSYTEFSRNDFLIRCKNLSRFINEGIDGGIRTYRKCGEKLGLYEIAEKKWGSLKLLDLILNYLMVSHVEGFHPRRDQALVIEALKKKNQLQIIPTLFALNDLRQLDAHRKDEFNSIFNHNLERFGIHPNSIGNNYSEAINIVYDKLRDTFSDLNMALNQWYDFD
ncbi:hypothetical protein [Reichenbachiella sp. MALMAid0571]|uniref:hypothetical protein n=1 Tax=Reichenbachiella sp. MALMAid0571 TaxID=3143939 RepID=UPI0032DF4964